MQLSHTLIANLEMHMHHIEQQSSVSLLSHFSRVNPKKALLSPSYPCDETSISSILVDLSINPRLPYSFRAPSRPYPSFPHSSNLGDILDLNFNSFNWVSLLSRPCPYSDL